jgi:hypothetical protein
MSEETKDRYGRDTTRPVPVGYGSGVEGKGELTDIQIDKTTRNRLRMIGQGETYDTIIVRLLDAGELTVSRETRHLLNEVASNKGETYEAIILRLLKEHQDGDR